MAGFNKVILMGNLTRDPDLRYTPQGTAVCDISLAVNTKKDEVAFVECVLWEKTAENVAEYKRKGEAIIVDGRLVQDSWEDKETGAKRSKLKVNAHSVTFMGKGGDGAAPAAEAPAPSDEAGEDEVPF